MKFHRSVPPYIQQFAEELLASCQFFPPREERFFALVGANNCRDERLDDFYQRLADSDPQQVKKLIFLLVKLDPDFALDRTDESIKAQEKLKRPITMRIPLKPLLARLLIVPCCFVFHGFFALLCSNK